MTYDPTFSSRADDATRNNIIYVETLDAFPAPVANVITLVTDTTYILTKPINFGINQVAIPTAGDVSLTSFNPATNVMQTELTGTTPFIIGTDPRRLDMRRIVINSLNSAGHCFDIDVAVQGAFFFAMKECSITSFNSIGDVQNASFVAENVGFTSNLAGLTFSGGGFMYGQELFFAAQQGDHLIFDGSFTLVDIVKTTAFPLTGDVVYNLDNTTVSSAAFFDGSLVSESAGGTSGLVKTISANETLDIVYRDIKIDTTGGVIQVELPDTSSAIFPFGYKIVIADTGNASTNNITIIPNASDSTTIDSGLTQYLLTNDNDRIILQFTNDSWEILNRRNVKSSITVTNTSTLTEIPDLVYGDTSGGTFTTTLPTAVGRKGKVCIFKKILGASPIWTLAGNGGELINGSSTLKILTALGTTVYLISNNIGWDII